MITEIGITAGEIWHFLDKNSIASIDELIVDLDRSRDLVLMSLGWLAREGHVKLSQSSSGYTISLRQDNNVK
jgi:winged helix-turn-helix protein DUF2582